MSENVTSFGVMVPLVKPVGDYRTENHESFSDWLDEIGLQLNYEGTLLFSEQRDKDGGCGIFFSNTEYRNNVMALCAENGIKIHEDQMQFFVSNWYNGADSHQSEMTLEKFNESLMQ